MSIWSTRGRWLRGLAAGLLAGSVAVLGCGQKTTPDVPDATEASPEAKSAAQAPASPAPAAPLVRDAQHQAFADAVRSADNPPADADRPPDQTLTGKPTPRIMEQVQAGWDEVRFTSPAGKKLTYTAVVETSAGSLQIALFPDLAPNHVRNFIALARAGYYDQLHFDRARHEKNEADQEVHQLEAGCPLGTGANESGSIGYWLKQEFTPGDKMSHEEGTVGACRGEDPDTAATRFYINLTRAPFLDGNYTIFGKVVQGLDVLRKMAQEPVVEDDEGVSRLAKSIVIHKVTILTQEAEAPKK